MGSSPLEVALIYEGEDGLKLDGSGELGRILANHLALLWKLAGLRSKSPNYAVWSNPSNMKPFEALYKYVPEDELGYEDELLIRDIEIVGRWRNFRSSRCI